jgi:hypothetical protein
MQMEFPAGTGFWILGDNFLQNYYAIFDLEQMRVGLVGSVSYKDVPRTFIDYIIILTSGLLTLVILYIFYQICCTSSEAVEILEQ